MIELEDLPKHLQKIFFHLREIYSSPGKRPPLIIKGQSGTGKSWIINSLYREIQGNFHANNVYPIYLPRRITGEGLVDQINYLIRQHRNQQQLTKPLSQETNLKFVLFLEGIDNILTLPGGVKESISERKGRLSTSAERLRHANELRRFLIEKNQEATIIATSDIETSFIEDPDQPFFDFFNIIEIDPLESTESKAYLLNKLNRKNSEKPLQIKKIFRAMEGISPSWIFLLTEGKISHLNLLAESFCEFQRDLLDTYFKDLLRQILNSYFIKLSPYVDLFFQKMNYGEKSIFEKICNLQNEFLASEVETDLNLSLYLTSMKKKGISKVSRSRREGRYQLQATSIKAWLRFNQRLDLELVVNTDLKNQLSISKFY